jgi:hypothetical protein
LIKPLVPLLAEDQLINEFLGHENAKPARADIVLDAVDQVVTAT